jgi:hypothetical protein
MPGRKKIPRNIETKVLVSCRRQCCLCVFLKGDYAVRKGQIAHLNQNHSDLRFENLVWLCFDHHDEYDGITSQARGLTNREVKTYRDKLYAKYVNDAPTDEHKAADAKANSEEAESEYAAVRQVHSNHLDYISTPWRFPLWAVANRPELFAYKAGNRMDGICLIERINLPDGRIVVAAIAVEGNPGNSITNCVEELCLQVCERFRIPSDRLVWLEHYDYYGDDWNMVTFSRRPPDGPFEDPEWTAMDAKAWSDLRLRPKKKLLRNNSEYTSKIRKLFFWPDEALDY